MSAVACGTAAPSSDLCATQDQWVAQLIALLPRGRAWGTHDGGPYPGSVLYAFWYAVAGVLAWFEALACALIFEFFCATTTTAGNRDLWMADYNLPDGCDPFPDLCSKVSALGGTRCDYYTGVCGRAGWAIACTDLYSACGAKAGAAMAGCIVAGQGLAAGVLLITVSLSKSPAYVGGAPGAAVSSPSGTPPFAGRMEAGNLLACSNTGGLTLPFAGAMQSGRQLACPPDLTGLECLLARIVGAHILIRYETVP